MTKLKTLKDLKFTFEDEVPMVYSGELRDNEGS